MLYVECWMFRGLLLYTVIAFRKTWSSSIILCNIINVVQHHHTDNNPYIFQSLNQQSTGTAPSSTPLQQTRISWWLWHKTGMPRSPPLSRNSTSTLRRSISRDSCWPRLILLVCVLACYSFFFIYSFQGRSRKHFERFLLAWFSKS